MELSKEATDICLRSKKVYALASLYHSDYFRIFNHYAEHNIEFHFIMTKDVLGKFTTEDEQGFETLLKNPILILHIP
ncbi:MAG: hypothetical protein R2741_05285 [Methanolobus sp.]